jgi:hypothetical protein
MIYLYTVLIALGLTYGLYVFYAAVMNLQRVRDMGLLTPMAKVLAYPTLVIGLILDLIVNLFVFTVVLLELPQELTVTARLKRHHKESTGWRLAVVKFLEPILDPLDPSGDHI